MPEGGILSRLFLGLNQPWRNQFHLDLALVLV
jgi:hypothetical protein